MAESVIVRQNSQFETKILALDPHVPDAHDFQPVENVNQMTPYGMLLAGLASCTAIVLHTYAQHHDVDLREVELHLQYERVFAEDCKDCEGIQEYKEQIEEEIVLTGDLTPEERKRLYLISRHCPIHKMLSQGIEIQSRLLEEDGAVRDRL
jgi:putative redox protein